MRRWMILWLAFCTACPPPAPPADTSPPDPDQQEPSVNEGRKILQGATPAEVCADDCLLLTRYDVHTLKHRFKELCCDTGLNADDPRCQTGVWPFPRDAPCTGWKRLEMCVYAKHGYVFKEDSEWKAVFEKEPWYQPNGTFNAGDMTILVKRNTLALRSFASGEVDCGPARDEPKAEPSGG